MTASPTPKLLQMIRVGTVDLQHRAVLAPMGHGTASAQMRSTSLDGSPWDTTNSARVSLEP